MKEDKAAAAPNTNQNGDHEEKQMKGDKAPAAAKSRPEWRSRRGANEGRQGCRSRRETSEGRQGGSDSQEQPRMEIRKWNKLYQR